MRNADETYKTKYTVTMFLVDTSPPMGTLKTVELPGPNGETISKTITHLEHVLQFVKLKIQDMVCCIFE